MAEGGTGWGPRAARSGTTEWDEGCGTSRHFLKGPHSWVDFCRDGSACCEHQYTHQGFIGRHYWSEGQGEICLVSGSAGSIHCSLLSPSSYLCTRHSAAIAVTSPNWITEVTLPRGFPETPPSPTHSLTSRCIFSESGAPCWDSLVEAADLGFWCGLLRQL